MTQNIHLLLKVTVFSAAYAKELRHERQRQLNKEATKLQERQLQPELELQRGIGLYTFFSNL